MMQEVKSGGMMILQQLKELNLKLPQLFTGSNISLMNLLIFAKKIAPPVLTWFSKISQMLLLIVEHILLFMIIINTKLPLPRPHLESNTLHLINPMSGIMKMLTSIE